MTSCGRPTPRRVRLFQYRKRYEVTCDLYFDDRVSFSLTMFQYRKRYEVTCDRSNFYITSEADHSSNTASGMRSHVTIVSMGDKAGLQEFQYRKRYEVTCDERINYDTISGHRFQYRKRYEVTCDPVPRSMS